MRRNLGYLLPLVAALGAWLAVDLMWTHVAVKHPSSQGFSSWCDMSAVFSCSDVAKSKWAAIPLGGRELPTSLLATGFFAVTALLGLIAARAKDEARARGALGFAFALSVPAALVSLGLIAVQGFVIDKWCLKCLLLDAAVFATALLAWFGHGGSGIGKEFVPNSGLLALCIALGLGVDGIAWNAYSDRVAVASAKKSAGDHEGHAHGDEHGEDLLSKDYDTLTDAQKAEVQKQIAEALNQARTAIQQFYADYESFPVLEVANRPFDGVKGASTAVVRVVEFADVECPHCQMVAPQVADLVERYAPNVELIFKNYPLGKKCNEAMTRDMHPDACQAAVAVHCAGREGKYWPMHEAVFAAAAEGGGVGTRALLRIGKGLGLDENVLETCLTEEAVWDEVRQQVSDGKEVGVNGTPTFFVNNRQLPSPHPVLLEAAVRRELLGKGVTSLPPDQDGVFGN